jgi:hypothetical protein
MAQATGTILVNSNPNANSKEIVIDDGQGGAFSSITFVTTTAATHPVGQNEAPLALRYNNNVGNTTPALYARFGGSSTTWNYGTLDDDWGLDGTRPAKLLISDSVGGTISITFSTATSGISGTSIFNGSLSDARKVSTGVYEVSIDSTGRTGHVMFGVYKCVQDAIDNDSFSALVKVLNYSNGSDLSGGSDGTISSVVLELKAPGQGVEHAGISVGLERASGSWSTSTGTDFLSVGYAYNNQAGMGALDGPNEAVYSMRSGPYDALQSGVAFSAAELADFIKKQINAMPIAMAATVSSTTVSLTNDAHGTEGNTTITTNDSTNFSVSGFSGGAAESSGDTTMAKRLTISAKQMELGSGLSGSTATKSALTLDLAGLTEATVADLDTFAFADVGSSNLPKKITFGDLEDTVFGNVSGDATIAAGGVLTIAATSVEGSMLNDNVISGQAALGGATVAQADLLMLDDGPGTVKKVTFSNFEDSIFANVNAASSYISVAAGGDITIDADGVSVAMIADQQLKDVAGLAVTDSGFIVGDGSNFVLETGATLRTSMGVGTTDAVAFAAGTFSGILKTDSTTDATSATDGSLQTDGGLSVVKDIIAGNDVKLLSDSAVLAMGAGSDVTITHDGGTGATLASAGAFVIDGAAAVTMDSDAALTLGGASIDMDADGGAVAIDGTGGLNLATATSGVAVSIGHTTSETTVNDNLTVTGDLTVNGTTVTINTTTVQIDDLNLQLADGAAAASSVDGGGITLANSGDDFTWAYNHASTAWKSSIDVDLATGKAYEIAGNSVLSATTLGSAVVNSSLTSLGTQAEALVMGGNAISGAGAIGSGAITSTGNVTAVGSFIIGSADMSEADLEQLDGITAGTAAASKAMVLSADADISGGRHLTITGELDAATLDLSGQADIDGAVNIKGAVTVGVDDTGLDVKFFGATAGSYMLWDESADDLKLVGAAGMTIAADLDVDGTTNLDAVDIDGAVQIDGAFTSGVDGQGYDSKFFGDTASAYMLWDTSADDLILAGGAGLVVPEGQLVLGATAMTSTAAELNLLDGVSGLVQADFTKLAAVDSTAAELNIMDGGTSATGTTLIAADRVVVNDDGTMVQVALSDLATLFGSGAGIQVTGAGLSISHSEVRQTGTACAASAVLFGSGGAYAVLTNTPASAAAVSVYFNGIMQSQGTDYTISGGTITLTATNSLSTADEVVVKYINQ